jgi:cysteine-S-conjugate beta-lyase
VNATGVGLAPFECFLLMRGVKTLSVRMERQQQSAMKVAQFLHDKGLKVYYPGLPSHPQYQLHKSMSRGPGAVLSFETGSTDISERIVENTRLWLISVSFGCVNSLLSY